MPIKAQYHKEKQLYELQISGTITRNELLENQLRLAKQIDAGDHPRILIVVDQFEGWNSGDHWDNLDFMFSHGSKITKIAFVGEKEWEEQLKLFAGAGIREAQVAYFEADLKDVALDWLLQ